MPPDESPDLGPNARAAACVAGNARQGPGAHQPRAQRSQDRSSVRGYHRPARSVPRPLSSSCRIMAHHFRIGTENRVVLVGGTVCRTSTTYRDRWLVRIRWLAAYPGPICRVAAADHAPGDRRQPRSSGVDSRSMMAPTASISAAASISRSPPQMGSNPAARASMAAATGRGSAPSNSASTACAATSRPSQSPSAPISSGCNPAVTASNSDTNGRSIAER